jgi:hypothetical protein
MGLDAMHVSRVRASFFGKGVTVNPHMYSANRAADPEENLSEELDQLREDRSDAIRLEMTRALYPYVLLRFLPCSEAAEKPVALAAIFHQNIVPLVMIRHDWQTGLDANDREYLIEFMDEWTRTPPNRVLALFRQLECLSIGPIRATVSGIATAEALEHLMYAVLGHAGAPRRWTM